MLGLGTNSIPVDSYRIPFESGVEMDVSVTSSGCIPVLETFKGSLAPNGKPNALDCVKVRNCISYLFFGGSVGYVFD